METLHADPSKAAAKTFAYDADHERRRKEQLCRLYDRTPEQVEEEEILRAELKKVLLNIVYVDHCQSYSCEALKHKPYLMPDSILD